MPYTPVSEKLLSCSKNIDLINQVSYLELKQYMANMLLRDTDFMSMAHSLEVRVPLIDHLLLEYLFQLPGEMKTVSSIAPCVRPKGLSSLLRKLRRQAGTSHRHYHRMPKPLLVDALDGLLPDEIIFRKKRGFTFPFARWLNQELRAEVGEVILDTGGVLEGILCSSGVEKLWRDFLANKTSWSRPWAIYVLKRWVTTFLE